MLLVVITALGTALVVQNDRASRREAELNAKIQKLKTINDILEINDTRERRNQQYRPDPAVEQFPTIEPMEIIKRGEAVVANEVVEVFAVSVPAGRGKAALPSWSRGPGAARSAWDEFLFAEHHNLHMQESLQRWR